jgi:predicted ATPase
VSAHYNEHVVRDSKIRMALTPGVRLGPYEIVAPLGVGGMGEVYRAHDPRLGRDVAVKVLPTALSADADRLRRFEQEARAAAALNHPNIVAVYDLGTHDGAPYVVSELLRGQTLREVIAQRVLPVKTAVDDAIQIANGLAAAHEKGVVHRDLKPENIFITSDRRVKILDFGLAKFAKDQSGFAGDTSLPTIAATTQPGIVLGTVGYMSPEQVRGQPVDHRSDIFSFGVVLFEMITGHRPFIGRTNADVIAAILGHETPELGQYGVEVPRGLQALIARLLAKDAADRPTSVLDALSTLQELSRSFSREPRLYAAPLQRLSEARPKANLPAEPTLLIGRDEELQELIHVIRDNGVRLVTLTGAGGTGKTRLAIAVAHRLRDDFADGVFFVSLESVSDPALIAPTIANVLAVQEVPGEHHLPLLQKYLASRQVLLVIDNFEHLVDSASIVAELLSYAPRTKALITSQAALRVRGEREFHVPPLPVPNLHDSLVALGANPAVALFVSRAKDVAAGFELTEENAAAVVEICRRLDGLPLAIELAAPRMRVFTPAAVLQKLSEPLRLLAARSRDLPPRQQTMRNAIEWSYSHLAPQEKALFCRLAVFSGGCSIDAGQQVCAWGSARDKDIVESFTSLIDKSLLRRVDDDHTGEPCFSMLQTIHSFATELLEQSGEAAELRFRHAMYFVSLAERVEPELHAGSGAGWLAQLDRELHDIRAALNWCAETGRAELALQLAGALLHLWLRRGHLSEGRSYLKRLLEAVPDSDEPQRARALYAAGVLAEAQGDFKEARRYLGQHLELHRRRGDAWGIASAMNNLGLICLRVHQYSAARALYGKSLELLEQVGNRPAIALSLQNLGNIERLEKHFEEARTLYRKSLAEFRTTDDDFGVAKSLTLLADLAREEGKLEEARTLGEEGLEKFMKLGEHREVAASLGDLGRVERASRNLGEAHSLYQESLAIFRELGDAVGAARMLEALASLAVEQNQPEAAIQLAAAAAGMRNSVGALLLDDERTELDLFLEPARHSLGLARAAELWRQGEALSLDQAVMLTEHGDRIESRST